MDNGRGLKMKKFFAVAMALILVLAFSSIAFADNGPLTDKVVRGGPSQMIASGTRSEPNTMDLRVNAIIWNGQSNFLFRGYDRDIGSPCTYSKQVTGTGYFKATYTSNATKIDMYASISSTSTSDYLIFSGEYYL